MQGLWKDTRKNYLKDKAKIVYRKSEFLDNSIYNEVFEDNYRLTTTNTICIESKVYFVTASKLVDTRFNFNSCKTCPLSIFNGAEPKYTESGIQYFRPCSNFQFMKDITEAKIQRKKSLTSRFHEVNPFCQKDNIYMSHNTHFRDFYVYFDYIEKKFRDYFTGELISSEWTISKKSNYYNSNKRNDKEIIPSNGMLLKHFKSIYQTFEETNSNRIYIRGRRNRKIKTDMIYGKPLESDFYERYFNNYYSCKSFYQKMANRLTRVRVKNWIKKGLKDPEIFMNSFHEFHSLEKSIAWAIS